MKTLHNVFLVLLIHASTAVDCRPAGWYAAATGSSAQGFLDSGVTVSGGLRGVQNLHQFAAMEQARSRAGQLHHIMDILVDYTESSGRSTSDTPAAVSTSLGLDDLVFEGPGSSAEVALNLVFTGGLEATFPFPATDASGSAEATERVQLDGYVGRFPEGAFSGWVEATSSSSERVSQQGHSELISMAGDALLLRTPRFEVPVGTPVNLSLQMRTVMHVRATNSTPSDLPVPGIEQVAEARSSRTLRFPVGLPVFDLPAGYSVRTAQGSIADNRYVPALEVAFSGGVVRVSWPSDGDLSLVLESAPNPTGPWTREARVTREGRTQVHVAGDAGAVRFYRLVSSSTPTE